MGHVFVARELALGRDVVIKAIRPDLLEGMSASRFTREVRLAARLQQANIVPVLTAGEAAGIPYYTMPFIAGESLRQRLDGGPPVPMGEAVSILRDVARALAFAHGEGVVHRDVKPANVLLSGGTAVVTDFGIAKAVRDARTVTDQDPVTAVGLSLGTPGYMSPEQVAGEGDTGPAADLYAWGLLAWELLARRHPFADLSSAQALMAAQLTREVPPLQEARREVPPHLSRLVARCLSKDPGDRPDSAGLLVEALDDTGATAGTGGWARQGGGAGPGPGQGTTPGRVRRPLAGRGPRVVAAGLAVVVLGAAGWWAVTRGASSTAPVDTTPASIAVLPFRDLSPDRESAYLGDGVAETLIHALSTVSGITVSGRTSAFSLRDREDDLQAIGERLDVSTVLLGSIQQAGGQLRVAARVVRVADDSILWSGTFDRSAAEIFAVQDEVARAVTEALRPRIDPARPGPGDVRAQAGGTASAEAYDAYLLGRYHWNLRTTAGMQAATAAFKEAIAADSSYALAWSGLADAYTLSIPGEYNVPGMGADSVLPLAEAAARRAIALAPAMGEGHVSLGEVLSKYQLLDEALEAFEQGVALSPGYPTGHQWYSYALLASGRWEEGIREMEEAHRLDPLAHVITLSLAVAYDGADRFRDAEPLYQRGLEQSPEAWYAWRFRVAHLLARGLRDAAGRSLARSLRDEFHPSHAAWASVNEVWDDPEALDARIDELTGQWEWDIGLILVRWLRGEDQVLGYLQRLRAAGTVIPRNVRWVVYAMVGPRLQEDLEVNAELEALVGG